MAILRAITERPLPDNLYLDARFFFSALGNGFPNHNECAELYRDAAAGPTRLYTSAIVFPEVIDALYKKILRSDQKGDLIDNPRLVDTAVWQELERLSRLLDDTIETASVTACKADGPVRLRARELQTQCKMRSFDAIHVATCLQRGITDVVTFDDDFLEPLDAATIWTSADLVHRWGVRLDREERERMEQEQKG